MGLSDGGKKTDFFFQGTGLGWEREAGEGKWDR